VLSQAIGMEELRDFSVITGVELAAIDALTTPRRFADELRWNNVYYRLARGM
jgi:L-arabinose isomerase